MSRRWADMSGRALWGLGDQVFSSATNFAVNILLARTLGASVFGAFSIAFGTYVIFLNLARALTAEPLAIRFSNVPDETWRDGVRQASGTTIAIGMVAGVICIVVAYLLPGDLRTAFLALGLTLPGLLHIDMWRFGFFARGSGGLAMLGDVLWAIIMFPALALIFAAPEPSLFLAVIAWGGSASVAGAIVVAGWGVGPAFGSIRRWLSSHKDLTPHFLGDVATVSVAGQVSLIGIGAVAGLAAVGAYRAVYVLFGPLRVIYQGLTLFGVPEAVRVLGDSVAALRSATRRLAMTLAAIAAVFGTIMTLMPDSWGRFILGETWELVAPLTIPFTLGVVGVGLAMPTYIGLRALEEARTLFHTRFTIASIDVVATIGGAALAGAVGAAWGGRGFFLLGAGLWWWVYERRLTAREQPLSPAGGARRG